MFKLCILASLLCVAFAGWGGGGHHKGGGWGGHDKGGWGGHDKGGWGKPMWSHESKSHEKEGGTCSGGGGAQQSCNDIYFQKCTNCLHELNCKNPDGTDKPQAADVAGQCNNMVVNALQLLGATIPTTTSATDPVGDLFKPSTTTSSTGTASTGTTGSAAAVPMSKLGSMIGAQEAKQYCCCLSQFDQLRGKCCKQIQEVCRDVFKCCDNGLDKFFADPKKSF